MFEINGKVFDIQYVSPTHEKLMKWDGTYALGCTDARDMCVYVNKFLKGALLRKVVCHELVHCFCIAYGCVLDVETEEICADFLATYGQEVFEVADEVLSDLMRYRYG